MRGKSLVSRVLAKAVAKKKGVAFFSRIFSKVSRGFVGFLGDLLNKKHK